MTQDMDMSTNIDLQTTSVKISNKSFHQSRTFNRSNILKVPNDFFDSWFVDTNRIYDLVWSIHIIVSF
jgi:hypothetical protein